VPEPLRELAPAKVNLTLHVTGQRADGYHLIDSLVAFPRLGDCLVAAPAAATTLEIDGPFAGALSPRGNLVLGAAALLGRGERHAALRLTKRLPVASGVGGGSADAAAALRVLARLWGMDLPPPPQVLALGADVPVCLAGRSCRMSGIGEVLRPVPLPQFWLVLVNPGVAVPTTAVFAALTARDNPPMPDPIGLDDAAAFLCYLAAQRNDLEPVATALAPPIAEARAALAAQPGCRLARMSGSGATCFGLFAAEAPARAAAAAVARARPVWWVAAGGAG
jgi:4-diphosphocytidyl-2-C-methyl-D-erythritol kinase